MQFLFINRFLNGDFIEIGVHDGHGSSELVVTSEGNYKCRAISDVGKTFSTTAMVTFMC